jgi:hypothetical protein
MEINTNSPSCKRSSQYGGNLLLDEILMDSYDNTNNNGAITGTVLWYSRKRALAALVPVVASERLAASQDVE